jgi:hypothetical protein
LSSDESSQKGIDIHRNLKCVPSLWFLFSFVLCRSWVISGKMSGTIRVISGKIGGIPALGCFVVVLFAGGRGGGRAAVINEAR